MSHTGTDVESDMSSDSEFMENDMLIKANKSACDDSFEMVREGTVFQENDSGSKLITVMDTTVVKVKDEYWRCVTQTEGNANVHHQLSCSQEEKAITAAYKEGDSKSRVDWARLVSISTDWEAQADENEKKMFGDKCGMSTALVAYIKKRQASRKRKVDPKPITVGDEDTEKHDNTVVKKKKRVAPTLVIKTEDSEKAPAPALTPEPSPRRMTQSKLKVLSQPSLSTDPMRMAITISGISSEQTQSILLSLLGSSK
jgi:hypothetical protein